MFVFGGNNSGIRDDYKINNSLRFRSSASGALTRTFGAGGNRQIWTWSAWVKRGTLNSAGAARLLSYYVGGGGDQAYIRFDNDTLGVSSISGGASQYLLITTQVFRDPSAWYHLVVSFDSTQATSSDRVKLYVNGSQITALSTANYPALNTSGYINSANNFRISGYDASNELFDGYLTEVNFIGGQALTPSSFGYTHPKTGVWRPKPYTGTYGTNGFYLKFSDIALTSGSNAGLGKDFSGNGNYWTTNNISVTAGSTYDAMTDVPTNTSETAANYPVAIQFVPFRTWTNYRNGNLTLNNGSVNSNQVAVSNMAFGTGKYYWETTITSMPSGYTIGVMKVENISGTTTTIDIGSAAGTYAYLSSGSKSIDGTSSAYGSSYGAGTTIAFTYDGSTGVLTAYRNNVSQGTLVTLSTSSQYVCGWGVNNTTGSATLDINFGQRPFTYTPPTGFKALNTFNLPNVTIPKGNKVMDALTYTGTGVAGNLTGLNFQPDFTWTKQRSSAGQSHILLDVNRPNENLSSDNNLAGGGWGYAFLSNGIYLPSGAPQVNASGSTYVMWSWKAANGTSSNTAGSITSTVSVNPTAGFSIVTYTGTGANATIGHGLGVAPKMIIAKRRDSSTDSNWQVWHTSLTSASYFLQLNTTAAQTNSNSPWSTGTVNSTIFTVEGVNATNNLARSSATYVAYCWAEIAGFSKFGSYTGNGSTNGPFVYLGFRPKFVLIKNSGAAADWRIYDTSRSTINVSDQTLFPNTAGAEGSGAAIDIVSNGFKLRNTANNGSANTYIYAAFAENPFKYSLAR